MTTYTMSRALNGVLQKRCCHESVLFSAYIACQNCVKVEDAKAMPFQLYLAIHNKSSSTKIEITMLRSHHYSYNYTIYK